MADSGASHSPEHRKLQGTFPWFKDGDVLIIITGSRQYQLHRSILMEISPKMSRDLLHNRNTAVLIKAATKKGVNVRNRLRAVEAPPDSDGPEVTLEPVRLTVEGRPTKDEPIPLDLENGTVVPLVYVAYENVLGAFYGREINFGEFGTTPLNEILTQALKVLEVAEYLEVVHIITKPLEAVVLAYGQIMWRAIAAKPAAWLDFAYRIQSRPIFRDAVIHGAAQYNTDDMQDFIKTSPFKPVVDLVEAKAKNLRDNVQRASLKLISYYPPPLQREYQVGLAEVDNTSRASYGNDIMTWFALTAFRHWSSQNIATDQTHHAVDMGWAFMAKIGKGYDAYLSKTDMEDFHKYFPMSYKAKAVLEARLREIKEHVRLMIQPLLKNDTQLDAAKYRHQYFTCTRINYEDYPWGPAYERAQKQAEEDSFMGEGDETSFL